MFQCFPLFRRICYPKIYHNGGIRNFLKVPNFFFWSVRRPCKFLAFLLLGYFWLNPKFTPKYTTRRGEEGIFNILLCSTKSVDIQTQRVSPRFCCPSRSKKKSKSYQKFELVQARGANNAKDSIHIPSIFAYLRWFLAKTSIINHQSF